MQITGQLLLSTCFTLMAYGQVQHLTYFRLPGAPANVDGYRCVINESGAVAADIFLPGEAKWQVFVMDKGEYQTLEVLPGYTGAFVSAINARGDVLGTLVGGIDQFDRPPVVWKNGLPSVISLPPPSNPANRQLVAPISLDNASRVLARITERTPGNQSLPPRHYILHGNNSVALPDLQPGGPVTQVHSIAYHSLMNSGAVVGSALVTRLGELRKIGFIFRNGQFNEILVDNMFVISGANQKGEVFGMRFDGGYFVWKDGHVRTYAPLLATDHVMPPTSWNNRGQTCVGLQPFRYAPGASYVMAILSFGDPDSEQGKP